MDSTVATITGAISVAALSGLTFLAYRHQKAYQKLSLFLSGILILGLGVILSWNLSIQWAGIAVNQTAYNLCPEKAYEIRKAIDAYTVPSWLFVAIVAWSFYILFLLSFPF